MELSLGEDRKGRQKQKLEKVRQSDLEPGGCIASGRSTADSNRVSALDLHLFPVRSQQSPAQGHGPVGDAKTRQDADARRLHPDRTDSQSRS